MVIRHPLQEHLANDFDGAGVCLPIEIADVIRKVWIPAGGTAWQQSALANLIHKLGLKVEIGRSRLLDDYWGDEARIGNAMLLNQLQQLDNPDSRIILASQRSGNLLEDFARSLQGTTTGDNPQFTAYFWELLDTGSTWSRFQSTVEASCGFGGRSWLLKWESGKGHLASNPAARIQGQAAFGRQGVVVAQMRELAATRYSGDMFDMNCAAIVPNDPAHLPALWCFASSSLFNKAVRAIDQKLNVTNATLVKVPFDLNHWRKVADERYPDGLPEPHSDDPTQWLFCGDIPSSTEPLHVAVARLLGYAWPEQREDGIGILLDTDGIVTLAPLVNQEGVANRLRTLLQVTYESDAPPRPKGAPEVKSPRVWDEQTLPRLMTQAGSPGIALEEWLREKFFEAHCKLFQQRPFIWHIWDGRRDGFHALVNYHRLDNKNLERLTHVYLGEWIEHQKSASISGDSTADGRLAAALELQRKLELIRLGEPPYDIFVRWKLLYEQPLGWEPDQNDSIRMNIRPFVEAGILRGRVNINWNKDRGKDAHPNASGTVERYNDLHFTLAQKLEARERRKPS